MFSATVAGIINFISMSLLGWVDSYLAIIVPAWATTTGLYLMKQFMDSNVSDAVLESARLDGSSEFNTFFRIAMPMVKPAWLTLIIYSFQGLWQTGSSTFIYSEELKTVNYAIGQILSAGAVRNGASAASSFSADRGVPAFAEPDHRNDGLQRYEGLRRAYEKTDKNTDVYIYMRHDLRKRDLGSNAVFHVHLLDKRRRSRISRRVRSRCHR